MGPFDHFRENELQAHHLSLSLNEKMRLCVQDRVGSKIDEHTFELPDLGYRKSFDHAGNLGLGWFAPKSESLNRCNFWYFLGFYYKPNPWFLPESPVRAASSDEGREPECVAFVGIWPSDVEEFVKIVKETCRNLIQKDFELVRSSNGSGVFLAP